MKYMLRRRGLGYESCNKIVAASKEIDVVVRNDRDHCPDDSVVIRWGCTSSVGNNCAVINSARAIHRVTDKLGFRVTIDEQGLCPPLYSLESVVWFPAIVRPSEHSQGRHCYLVNNLEEYEEAVNKCEEVSGRFYVSEYIPKVAEYRVFVVSGRVACVAKKTPANPDAIVWNVHSGGRFDNVRWGEWPLGAIETALEAFSLSRLDFGGVDVMVAPDGRSYVLEINSAPTLFSPYRAECMAKCFDYLIREGKEQMGYEDDNGWRGYIHPAVLEREE